jgi:hypothetical protein
MEHHRVRTIDRRGNSSTNWLPELAGESMVNQIKFTSLLMLTQLRRMAERSRNAGKAKTVEQDVRCPCASDTNIAISFLADISGRDSETNAAPGRQWQVFAPRLLFAP